MNSHGIADNPGLRTAFIWALALNFAWINASEVFRYFVFVMPMIRDTLSMAPDVAPMDWQVFLVWGIWDTILVCVATAIPWMVMTLFGGHLRNAVAAGTGTWLAVFVIFWLGTYNMNLATPEIVLTALPLAWLEMCVAALIVWRMCFAHEAVQTTPAT